MSIQVIFKNEKFLELTLPLLSKTVFAFTLQ